MPGFLALAPAVLLSTVYWVHPPPPRDPPAVTVLCYHNYDAEKKTPFTVSSRTFYEQLRFIKVQHYPVISLAQLVDYLQKGTPVPNHSVVITIDDGYKTARTKAWPILRKFDFPFTLFVYPQFIGHKSGLTWDDLKVLSDAGVDIESHSLTHPLLTHPSKPMTRKEYIDWIDHELIEPKHLLEAAIGKPVKFLAYPFGGYDETVVDRVQKAGYTAALTCDDGNVTRFTDPLHINRRLVYRSVRPREFSQYFPDHALHVGELWPRDGERVREPIHEIRARVLNIEKVLAGSGLILVDKLGRKAQPVAIDPKTGILRIPIPKDHKKGYYFVSLFARDKAQPKLQREASWLFIISKNASRN